MNWFQKLFGRLRGLIFGNKIEAANYLEGVKIPSKTVIRTAPLYSNIYSWFKTSFYIRFTNGTFCIYSNYFRINTCDDYSIDINVIKYLEHDTAKFVSKSADCSVDFIELIGTVKMSCPPEEIKDKGLANVINSEFNFKLLN